MSCYLLFIHKSNLVVVVGVASIKGHTYKARHLSTMDGRISSDNVFWEGDTNFGSSFNTNLHIHTFSQVFKGKYPLVVCNTKSFKNNFYTSSCFITGFVSKKRWNCTYNNFWAFFGQLHTPNFVNIHRLWTPHGFICKNFSNICSKKIWHAQL